MKIIMGGRGVGKTTRLIELSANTGDYIVVYDSKEAHRVFEAATKLKMNIPFPITYAEVVLGKYYGKGINGFLIDDLLDFIRYFLPVPVHAATFTPDEIEHITPNDVMRKHIDGLWELPE